MDMNERKIAMDRAEVENATTADEVVIAMCEAALNVAYSMTKLVSGSKQLLSMTSAKDGETSGKSETDKHENMAFEAAKESNETVETDRLFPAPCVLVFNTDFHMKQMSIDDCFATVEWFGDSNVLIPIPGWEGVYLTCQDEDLWRVEGLDYLVGQAVVIRADKEMNPLPLTGADAVRLCKFLDRRAGIMIDKSNNEKRVAFCLS